MRDVFPVRMPWTTSREIPHGCIEVNQSCNIGCRGCYKIKSAYQKPFGDICKEIDLMAAKRNLSAITLTGGEPTLHPELPAVIAYVASKGIAPMMLTNATLLTAERARQYKRAGLTRVFLHIDAGQKGRPDGDTPSAGDVQALRDRYAAICAEAGLTVGLIVTLHKNGIDDFLRTIDACFKDPRIDRIVVTNYTALVNAEPRGDDDLTLKNADVRAFMLDNQAAQPCWFWPSSHDDNKHRWLFYYAMVTVDGSKRVKQLYFHPSQRLALSLLPRLLRAILGRHEFELEPTRNLGLRVLWMYTLASFSPSVWARAADMTVRALRNDNMRVFVLIFQEGPTLLPDGSYETCKDCPDATIRNGQLIPVCLVDRLAPPDAHQWTASATTAS